LTPNHKKFVEKVPPITSEMEPIHDPNQDQIEENIVVNDDQHLRRSSRISRRAEGLIETHMLTARGINSRYLLPEKTNKPQSELTRMNNIIMTQYGMKQGLKDFG
jgi:hypothetical protein